MIPVRTLNLGAYRRAKVWLNTMPGPFNGSKQPEAETQTSTRIAQAAVEMLLPTGGVVYYGLIGGRLFPSVEPRLRLEIQTPEGDGLPYASDLAFDYENARVGIPLEYREAISDGFNWAVENSCLNLSGTLCVYFGVNGDTGSSIVFYRYLSAVLVRLFTLTGTDATDDEIQVSLPTFGEVRA